MAFASNFACFVLAVLASLISFRLMIAWTDTPTVGLWALIVGFATTVVVAEMGLSANLTRFVAASENASQRLIARLGAVGAIMALLPGVLMALLAAWPIYRFAVTRPDLPIGAPAVAALTGLALGAMLLTAVCAIIAGLAEGLGRVWQRSASLLLYNVVALTALWPCLQIFGPAGIGVANLAGVVAQLAMVLAVLFLAARKLPRVADEETVGVLLRALFSSTMQNFGILVTRLTVEVVTRFYVGTTGSLTVQAWFELALRVSNQVRQVVLIGLQPLLYIGASDQAAMVRRFERPQAITVRLSALLYLGLTCTSPLISIAVLGQIEPGFILFIVILGAGGAVMTTGLPGQYAIAASGQFGVLLRFAVVLAVLNVVLGGLGAMLGGAAGAAAGLAAALVANGVLLLHRNARMVERPFWSLLDGFWLVSLAAVIIGIGLALASRSLAPLTVVALSAASCLLLIAPGWALARMFLRRDA